MPAGLTLRLGPRPKPVTPQRQQRLGRQRTAGRQHAELDTDVVDVEERAGPAEESVVELAEEDRLEVERLAGGRQGVERVRVRAQHAHRRGGEGWARESLARALEPDVGKRIPEP